MWDNFVKQHANTIMVVNGHFIRDTGGSRRRDLGVNWNLVNQMFSNYQDFKNGGNGYLRILKFRPSLNVIEVSTYSPWLDASLTDDDNQFTVPYHRPATSGTTGTIKGRTRGRRLNGFYDCKSISDANVSDGTDSATTDSTGRFDFTLTHGTYTLTASKSAWVTTSKGIGVYAGYTTDAPMFLKPVVGKVTGKVTDSSGAAISGANLNFSGGKLTPTKALNFLTDSSGNYTTASLSVGSYEVTISKTGYVTETRTKTVTADTTGTLNVTLQKQ
jgi:hypothetical protein